MTKEYFDKMKASLVEVYKEDLCEDSLDKINAASDVAEFIAVLHEFSAYLKYKNIPKIDWVREWFGGEYRSEANLNGCYIDQYAAVKDPKTPIVLFGTSKVNAIFTKPTIYSVVCQDKSEISTLTYGNSVVNIRLKDESTHKVMYKERTSKVKVRTV